jgi:hypothetical protein
VASATQTIPVPADPREFGEDCATVEERAAPPATGCKRLAEAILHDVFKLRTKAKPRHMWHPNSQAAKDERWVQSDASGPLTFGWWCGLLDLDHETVREAYLSIEPRP